MHNPKRMTSFDNANDNFGQLSGLPLGIMTSLDNPIKELTSGTKLHNNMDIKGILVSTLDGNNILMTGQMMHNLNLPPDILDILFGNKFPLGNRFASIFNRGGIVKSQKSSTELTLTELSAKSVYITYVGSLMAQDIISLVIGGSTHGGGGEVEGWWWTIDSG